MSHGVARDLGALWEPLQHLLRFDEEGKLKANCSNLRRKIWKKLKYSEGIEYYVCEGVLYNIILSCSNTSSL